MEKNFSLEKIFREINTLVKALLSRNFRQNSVRVNFRNSTLCENSLKHFFGKNFVKATVLLKCWFHEIFFCWEIIFLFSILREIQILLNIFDEKFRESIILHRSSFSNENVLHIVPICKFLRFAYCTNFWKKLKIQFAFFNYFVFCDYLSWWLPSLEVEC